MVGCSGPNVTGQNRRVGGCERSATMGWVQCKLCFVSTRYRRLYETHSKCARGPSQFWEGCACCPDMSRKTTQLVYFLGPSFWIAPLAKTPTAGDPIATLFKFARSYKFATHNVTELVSKEYAKPNRGKQSGSRKTTVENSSLQPCPKSAPQVGQICANCTPRATPRQASKLPDIIYEVSIPNHSPNPNMHGISGSQLYQEMSTDISERAKPSRWSPFVVKLGKGD